MVFTSVGKQFVAWSLGSDVGNYINHIGIGDGSGTALESNVTLVSERNRTQITGSPNFTTAQKVSFQADFNSVQMSGISLTEIGLFNQASGTGFPGSVWLREAFGSVVFDGGNELQILTTLEVL